MQPELHFSRFEFKYLLPGDARSELESELGYFMALDPYVRREMRQKYFVRSLYFDDDTLTSYYEKTDGVMIRRKFRIRTYTDRKGEPSPVFLEAKGRHNALVYKHRVELPGDAVDALERGQGALVGRLIEFNREAGNDVVRGFVFEALRRRLKPRVLIDYERRPYVSRFAPDFRVTFDDTLTSAVCPVLFGGDGERRRLTLPGYSIVEVKFKRHIPSWFHRLIQSYELRRISVSKYCKGMETAGLAENLE